MPDQEIIWTSPTPVWANLDDPRSETTRLAFRQPALLRFATDSFMEEFIATLESDPARVSQLRAQPESWREPPAPLPPLKSLPPFAREFIRSGLGTARPTRSVGTTNIPTPQTGNVVSVSTNPKPLKLYHPAHQRFYLVAAGLTCQMIGLPDRVVNTGSQERVSFVLRRLLPASNSNLDEYAFVGGAWQKLNQPETTLAIGEEELPLSAVTYAAQDGRKRRVWIGLVPVGKREAYLGAAAAPTTEETNNGDVSPVTPSPREMLLIAQVLEPWKSLITQAETIRRKAAEALTQAQAEGKAGEAQTQNRKLITAARSQLQEASWYILLDFAQYLEDQLNPVWTALKNNAPGDAATPEGRVIAALRNTQLPGGFAADLVAGTSYMVSEVAGSLAEALIKIKDWEADQPPENSIENKLTAYDRADTLATPTWPDFLFPLADPKPTGSAPTIPQPPGTPNPTKPLVEAYMDLLDALKATVLAVPAANTAPLPAIPLAAQPPFSPGDPGNFLIRCIYQRPNCGPSQPPLISAPTPVFQMAAFFDPDAPARPIRIALPVDTTPAGLRKFNKNTAFVISDVLCGQIDRAKGLGLADLVLSVLPWPFHKDLSLPDKGPCRDDNQLSLGMICSLSIPIVTICALILLMIIISLLDFIFRWMPFFIMCFPLPGLKAKPSTP